MADPNLRMLNQKMQDVSRAKAEYRDLLNCEEEDGAKDDSKLLIDEAEKVLFRAENKLRDIRDKKKVADELPACGNHLAKNVSYISSLLPHLQEENKDAQHDEGLCLLRRKGRDDENVKEEIIAHSRENSEVKHVQNVTFTPQSQVVEPSEEFLIWTVEKAFPGENASEEECYMSNLSSNLDDQNASSKILANGVDPPNDEVAVLIKSEDIEFNESVLTKAEIPGEWEEIADVGIIEGEGEGVDPPTVRLPVLDAKDAVLEQDKSEDKITEDMDANEKAADESRNKKLKCVMFSDKKLCDKRRASYRKRTEYHLKTKATTIKAESCIVDLVGKGCVEILSYNGNYYVEEDDVIESSSKPTVDRITEIVAIENAKPTPHANVNSVVEINSTEVVTKEVDHTTFEANLCNAKLLGKNGDRNLELNAESDTHGSVKCDANKEAKYSKDQTFVIPHDAGLDVFKLFPTDAHQHQEKLDAPNPKVDKIELPHKKDDGREVSEKYIAPDFAEIHKCLCHECEINSIVKHSIRQHDESSHEVQCFGEICSSQNKSKSNSDICLECEANNNAVANMNKHINADIVHQLGLESILCIWLTAWLSIMNCQLAALTLRVT